MTEIAIGNHFRTHHPKREGSHGMRGWTLKALILAVFLSTPQRPDAQAAVLYKEGRFTAHDKAIKGANNYGDLQGPAIENRHFALFVSVMEAHIHADMIGKRIPGLQLHRFSQNYDRHGGWDWGEDILKVGTTLGAGTPGLLLNGSLKTFDIAQMDSLIVSIPDSTAAHPVLRIWAYGWRVGLPMKIDFHWTLRTRFDDRFMQGEAVIAPATGAIVALGVIKAANASVRRDSARSQLAMMGRPTYFNDSAVLAVRSAPTWFRGFLDQDGFVGLSLTPDAEGNVRWTQGGSWIQEPQPVWRLPEWETTWLPEPARDGSVAVAVVVKANKQQTGRGPWAPGFTYTLRTVNGRFIGD